LTIKNINLGEEKLSKVMLRKNKKLIATFNDPSDVEDYLINQGLPKALFLKNIQIKDGPGTTYL